MNINETLFFNIILSCNTVSGTINKKRKFRGDFFKFIWGVFKGRHEKNTPNWHPNKYN